MKRIYFVRHGQTKANVDKLIVDKDEPLNDYGLHQANIVAERTRAIDFDVLFASDFVRAQQTAKAISQANNIPMQTNSCFGETRDPSEFIGESEDHPKLKELRAERKKNIENPDWNEGDGETPADVFARVQIARNFLVAQEAENIMVVSHAMFTRYFAAAIITDEPTVSKAWFTVAMRMRLSNTGICMFTFEDDSQRLFLWNDLAHFAE